MASLMTVIFFWHQNLLWKNKIVVPYDSTLKNQLLYEYHSTPIGGHAGLLRTYACLGRVWLGSK